MMHYLNYMRFALYLNEIMKLKIFLLFIFLTSFHLGKSEILKLGQSAPFEAPQKGFVRLFALDNGNASYVKYFKGELDFRLHDKGYKLCA